jgi:hypothetical protein
LNLEEQGEDRDFDRLERLLGAAAIFAWIDLIFQGVQVAIGVIQILIEVL